MPLSGKILQGLMLGQCSAKGIVGPKIPDFTGALSDGIVNGFLDVHTVKSIDTGFLPAGLAGIGTGKLTGINKSGMLAIAQPLLTSEQILGTKSKDLADACLTAMDIHFKTLGLALTLHPFVGVGTGLGKIEGVTGESLAGAVMGLMAARGLDGEKLYGLVKSIATGFAVNLLTTGIINLTISGTPLLILGVPVPSGGVGTGEMK